MGLIPVAPLHLDSLPHRPKERLDPATNPFTGDFPCGHHGSTCTETLSVLGSWTLNPFRKEPWSQLFCRVLSTPVCFTLTVGIQQYNAVVPLPPPQLRLPEQAMCYQTEQPAQISPFPLLLNTLS